MTEINGSPYAFWDTSARQEPASSVVPVFPPSTVTFSGAFFSPVRYLSVELIPGDKAPHLITKEMLSMMQPGTVLVDVAIDQGGCFETSHPTTHSAPTYIVDGIVHYAVANIPGAVPYTSTLALTNATRPYVIALANKGWKKACKENTALALGLNIVEGKIEIGRASCRERV